MTNGHVCKSDQCDLHLSLDCCIQFWDKKAQPHTIQEHTNHVVCSSVSRNLALLSFCTTAKACKRVFYAFACRAMAAVPVPAPSAAKPVVCASTMAHETTSIAHARLTVVPYRFACPIDCRRRRRRRLGGYSGGNFSESGHNFRVGTIDMLNFFSEALLQP